MSYSVFEISNTVICWITQNTRKIISTMLQIFKIAKNVILETSNITLTFEKQNESTLKMGDLTRGGDRNTESNTWRHSDPNTTNRRWCLFETSLAKRTYIWSLTRNWRKTNDMDRCPKKRAKSWRGRCIGSLNHTKYMQNHFNNHCFKFSKSQKITFWTRGTSNINLTLTFEKQNESTLKMGDLTRGGDRNTESNTWRHSDPNTTNRRWCLFETSLAKRTYIWSLTRNWRKTNDMDRCPKKRAKSWRGRCILGFRNVQHR